MSRIYDVMRQTERTTALAPTGDAQSRAPRHWSHAQVPRSTDVPLFLYILQRQWRVVAGCAGAVLGAVTLATLLMKPVYEPWARLEVDPPGYEEFSLDAPHVPGEDIAYLQ